MMAAYDCRSNVHGEPVEYTGPDLNFGEDAWTSIVECETRWCSRRFIVRKCKGGSARRFCAYCMVIRSWRAR